jgi:membrane associated rhomboid family serine protease
MTWTFIGLNLLVSLYVWTLPGDIDALKLLIGYGVIPQRIFDNLRVGGGDLLPSLLTLITHQFLHGGLLHLVGNMLFLKVFGEALEMRLGWGGYILFYLLGGVVAGVVHMLASTVTGETLIPTIGASGAVSAILGAYLALFPGKRVTAIIFIPIPLPLKLPTFIVLGWWFVQDYIAGIITITPQAAAGLVDNVAYWAHIGGFVLGMLVALPLLPPNRPHRRRAAPPLAPALRAAPPGSVAGQLLQSPSAQSPSAQTPLLPASQDVSWTATDGDLLDQWVQRRDHSQEIDTLEEWLRSNN